MKKRNSIHTLALASLASLLAAQAHAQNIAIANATLTEGNTGTVNLDFPITVNPTSATAITLSYSTSAGSATAGSDFVAVTGGTISIPANTASAVARVVINNDLLVEQTQESLQVTISAPSSGSIVTGQALGQISDNDSTVVSIAARSQPEGNSGTAPMPFSVSLSNPVQAAFSLNVASNDGTAAAPSDYTAIAAGTVINFPALNQSQALNVAIAGDSALEGDEIFNLVLSAIAVPVGYSASAISIAPGAISGTIQNDDSVNIAIAGASATEAEQQLLRFPVRLSGTSDISVSVAFTTVDGTATAPQDYTASTGTVTFAPGETTKQILVPVISDGVFEFPEQLSVQLSNPLPAPGVNINPTSAIGVIGIDRLLFIPTLNGFGAFALLVGLLGFALVRGFGSRE